MCNDRSHVGRDDQDLVLSARGRVPLVIECKWSEADFEPTSVKAFRRQYPEGTTFVVSNDVDRRFRRTYEGVKVDFLGLPELISELHQQQRADQGRK